MELDLQRTIDCALCGKAGRALIGRSPDEQGDHQAAKSSSGILEDSECSHTEGDWFSRPGVLRKSAGTQVRIRGLRQYSQAEKGARWGV